MLVKYIIKRVGIALVLLLMLSVLVFTIIAVPLNKDFLTSLIHILPLG